MGLSRPVRASWQGPLPWEGETRACWRVDMQSPVLEDIEKPLCARAV